MALAVRELEEDLVVAKERLGDFRVGVAALPFRQRVTLGAAASAAALLVGALVLLAIRSGVFDDPRVARLLTAALDTEKPSAEELQQLAAARATPENFVEWEQLQSELDAGRTV